MIILFTFPEGNLVGEVRRVMAGIRFSIDNRILENNTTNTTTNVLRWKSSDVVCEQQQQLTGENIYNDSESYIWSSGNFREPGDDPFLGKLGGIDAHGTLQFVIVVGISL